MSAYLQKAVFLDRDGVLNIDIGYPHRIEDCVMIDGADMALKLLNDHGYTAYIVTNQGGIGLGYFDHAALDAFHDTLLQKLSRSGGVITDIAACPHHPKSPDPDMRACDCRKPKPGMLHILAEKHDIDLDRSIMIGDRDTDVAAAEAAGCKGYLFEGGNLHDFIKPILDGRS